MPMWQMNDENLEFYKTLSLKKKRIIKKLNVYQIIHIIDNDEANFILTQC